MLSPRPKGAGPTARRVQCTDTATPTKIAVAVGLNLGKTVSNSVYSDMSGHIDKRYRYRYGNEIEFD